MRGSARRACRHDHFIGALNSTSRVLLRLGRIDPHRGTKFRRLRQPTQKSLRVVFKRYRKRVLSEVLYSLGLARVNLVRRHCLATVRLTISGIEGLAGSSFVQALSPLNPTHATPNAMSWMTGRCHRALRTVHGWRVDLGG